MYIIDHISLNSSQKEKYFGKQS